jgi:hypothetical protein
LTSFQKRNARRAVNAYSVFRACLAALVAARVVAAVVAGTALALVTIPQAVDSTITLAQDDRAANWALVLLSTMWLTISAWFWTREALAGPAMAPMARHPWLRDAVARALGTACTLAVANALWRAASVIPAEMTAEMGEAASGATPLRWAAACVLATGIMFVVGTAPALARHAPHVRVGPRWMVLATMAIAASGMALFGTDPLRAAHYVAPLPTILFAAAGLICGGVALGRLGARWHMPLLGLVIFAALGLAVLRDHDILPDNHDIMTLPGQAVRRSDVPAAFEAFLAATQSPGTQPTVVLVATGGGGLAAADFTATVLGDLADNAPEFARHIFAISGVSGGALGAADYVLARKQGACRAWRRLRPCLEDALAADFLGPAVGVGLYTDLFQRFLPFVLFSDRQAAMERAWDAQWHAAFGDHAMRGKFLGAWQAGRPWPALLLNGTSERTGGRLVTSNLDLRKTLSGDGVDLLSLLDGDIAFAAAIGTSARFPYVSPMGVLRPLPGGPIVDRVADGGYFESLGATTALDVLDQLVLQAGSRRMRFVVLEIVSDPDMMHRDRGPGWVPLGVSGPEAILFRSRDARGIYAAQALARRVKALGGVYVPIALGRSATGRTAPLGWSLSATARGVIGAQWTPAWRQHILDEVGY